MELRQYLNLLKKWLWLIILGGILAAGSAYAFSVWSPPVYQSTVTLLINQGSNPVSDPYNAILTSQRVAATYVEQLKSPVIAGQVINDLNLPFTPKALASLLSVQLVRDTQLVRISIEDTDPERAQAIANQVAKAFISYITTTQQTRYQAGQKDLDAQVAEVRKKIDDTQKALAPLVNPSDSKNFTAPEFVRTEQMRLQLELTTYQAQYTVLLKSQQDFRLAVSRYEDSITISAPPEVPQTPVRPNKMMNTLLGGVVGLFLGVGTAFLIEYLDDSLKSSDDVSRVLQLSTLGNVMRFPKSAQGGLVAADAPRAPYAEAYRNLRTNLQFSLPADSAALVVSSAEPGEGKTTTVANLAVVMAQMGKRVILVDTDLRRPALHYIFRVPPEPGLTDLFLNNQPLEHVIRETSVPGLRLITCGKLPPNPAELLASPWMEQLILTLKKQFDVVLFDSPPILPVTDAALLASKTKHLLWVIFAGKTRTDSLRRAQESLAQVDAKVVGVVLNRITSGSGYGYYNYYYYHSKDRSNHKRKHSEAAVVPNQGAVLSGNGNGQDPNPVTSPEILDE